MKINPPKAAIERVNAAQKAQIESVAAINKAAEPVASSHQAAAESTAEMLEENEKRLWTNLLAYPECYNYLLSVSSVSGDMDYRLAVIMRWLTNATVYDYVYAHEIQQLANKKYGDCYDTFGPDVCVSCATYMNAVVEGGRLRSHCPKCGTRYAPQHSLVMFKRVIAQKMFISVQEFEWRMACSVFSRYSYSIRKQST
jgi:hypothetical protein